MYSIQALWTASHDKHAIVFVILSNWECGILKHRRQNFATQTQHPPADHG